MLIYLFLLTLILGLNFMRKAQKISDKLFCIICCGMFILVTGLRHNMVGSDTTVYYLGFNEMTGRSLSEIIALEKRDFGFFIFEWAVLNTFHNFVALTLIVAGIFYIPVTILIYRYSKDYGFSYLILMAFMFFQFSMTGIRQTMALGFTVLFVLELLKEKKRILWLIIWAGLGISMHRSCLIILPFILLFALRKYKIVSKVVLLLLPIVFVFREQLAFNATDLFAKIGFELEQYEGNSGGLTTFLLYFILFVWGLFFTYIGEKENEMSPLLLSTMGVATILQVFVLVNSIFFRVVWYYSIFLIIYIPQMLCASRVTNRSHKLMNVILVVGLLYMYLGITIGSANVLPYQFFWQGI